MTLDDLAATIRTIPDYPKPGVQFRDITTLLSDAKAFRCAVDALVEPWRGERIDKVAGMEARGFILGGAVAHQLNAGFVPIRKKGKLPHSVVSVAYSLEYGIDEMELHEDAARPGERVVLVDDLIATGGTAEAAVTLLRRLGAEVVAACFVIDLPELGGAQKVARPRRARARAAATSPATKRGGAQPPIESCQHLFNRRIDGAHALEQRLEAPPPFARSGRSPTTRSNSLMNASSWAISPNARRRAAAASGGAPAGSSTPRSICVLSVARSSQRVPFRARRGAWPNAVL